MKRFSDVLVERTSLNKNQKVLMMYITKVSGHRRASVAIQQIMKQLDPTIEAPMVNGFGYTYPVMEKVVNQAYMSVIKTVPFVWEYIYDNPKIVKNSYSLKKFVFKTSAEKIGRLFEKFKPDTVVCTQAFPCGMVANYKKVNGLKTKIIGVLTDFAPHSFWINEGVDYYVVPSVETRECFIRKGVNPDSIKVFGIPIQMKFSGPLDKRTTAKKMNLDPDISTILIMGGGQGLGPIKSILKSLIKVDTNFQIIVLAGTNKRIIHSLHRVTEQSDKKIVILEYSNNVNELMDLATIIITKPGGITVAECLAKGLPMVIVDPIPGQEMYNTNFLINKGIGIRVDKTIAIGGEVELLLNSPEKLSTMSKVAYKNARPNSALDITNLIINSKQKKMDGEYQHALNIEKYV